MNLQWLDNAGNLKMDWLFLILLSVVMVFSQSVQSKYLPEYNLFYSGEVKLSYQLNIAAEPVLVPEYYLYLQGAPVKQLFFLTQLRSGGEAVDRVYLQYNPGNLELEYGDSTLTDLGGQFFAVDQNQRGVKASYRFPGWPLSLQVLQAEVKGINFAEEVEGDFSTGPYYLSYSPIIADSIVIKREGVLLGEGDYQLDYQTGCLILKEHLDKNEFLQVSYTYLPGGGNYRRKTTGITVQGGEGKFKGRLQLLEITDNPRNGNLISDSPVAIRGAVFSGTWRPIGNIRVENELAFSEASGIILEEQFNESGETDPLSDPVGEGKINGLAYQGTVRWGNYRNYLGGGYTYRGNTFVNSLEEPEPVPLVEYNLNGRWQIKPTFYVFTDLTYSQDNPDGNPELITSYQSKRLIKGYWQQSPSSSLQLLYQEEDKGDDLVYLPIGKIGKSAAIQYNYRGPMEVSAGVELGQWDWKNPASNLDSQYLTFNSGLGWKRERWRIKGSGELTLSRLIKADEDSPQEYYLDYLVGYKLDRGEIVLKGERAVEADYQRRVNEFELKRDFTRRSAGSVSYIQERKEYPEAVKTDNDDRLLISGMYNGKIIINTSYSRYLKRAKESARLNIKGGAAGIGIDWQRDGDSCSAGGSVNFRITPQIKVNGGLKYQQEEGGQPRTVVFLGANYRINEHYKIGLSGERELKDEGETKACLDFYITL